MAGILLVVGQPVMRIGKYGLTDWLVSWLVS